MENELWQKYLDSATSGIRDKKTRAEVREELLSHLEDRKERFLRFNMSEEEAEKKAVGQMGDSEKVSVQLGQIHSRIPVEELNTALLEIFFGFLFTFFTFKISEVDIVKPFGTVLIFMGMYQLRHINPKLKKAFAAEIALLIWCIINVVLPAIPFYSDLADSAWIYAVTAFGSLMNIVRTALLFLGIDDLRWTVYRKDETSLYEPRMIRALIAYVIMYVIMFVSASFGFAYAMLAIVPFMVYVLYQLRKTQSFIHKSNYRTESIEKFGKRGTAVISGLVALLLVLSAITMYAVAAPKVKSEPVNIVRTEEVNKIREELIDEGFPQRLAYSLPDEEIKKCYPFDKSKNIVTTTDTELSLGPKVYAVGVPLVSDEGYPFVRYIYGFNFADCNNIIGYRDSFLSHQVGFPVPDTTTYGVYYKDNGALYKQEALNTHCDNFGLVDGLEYRTVKGAEEMYGYLAVTCSEPSSDNEQTAAITYVMGKHFWNYPYFSAFDTYGEFNKPAFNMFDVMNEGGKYYPEFLAYEACYKFTGHTAPVHDMINGEMSESDKSTYRALAREMMPEEWMKYKK